jgi:hypothetical protein
VSENLTSVKFIEKFYCRSNIISLPQKNILLRQKKKIVKKKYFPLAKKSSKYFAETVKIFSIIEKWKIFESVFIQQKNVFYDRTFSFVAKNYFQMQ